MINHRFKAGETIVAAIKRHNRYDVTEDELVELRARFKELNPSKIIHPGDMVIVPVLARHLFPTKEAQNPQVEEVNRPKSRRPSYLVGRETELAKRRKMFRKKFIHKESQ